MADSLLWTPTVWDPSFNGLNDCQAFAYKSPVLMAVGDGSDNGPVVYSSTSGGDFLGESSAWDFNSAQGIVHADWLNLWVLAANDFSKVIGTSPGGGTWTVRTSPWDGVSNADAMAKSEFQQLLVAVSQHHGHLRHVMTSANATAWTERTTPWDATSGSINAVGYSPTQDQWLAGGFDNVGVFCLMTSPTAVTWTSIASPFDDNGHGQGQVLGIKWADDNSGWWITGKLLRSDGAHRVLVFSADLSVFTVVAVQQFDSDASSKANFLLDADTTLIVGGQAGGSSTLVLASSDDGGVSWGRDFATGWNLAKAGIWVADRGLAYAGGEPASGYDAIRSSDLVPIPSGVVRDRGPLWRYFIADLSGGGITDYSKLAADRTVEVVLNAPLTVRGTVPSDNPQVWIPYDGDGYDDPYLAEGTRLLWGFRRESATPPYYTVRAATIVQLVQDTAQQDDARTQFVGWDPWHYLFSRPVVNSAGGLPGKDGLSFTNTQASVVIASLLKWTIDSLGHVYVDAGVTYSGTGSYNGTLETGAAMEIDINFQQGTSVGQAWQQVTALGVCDIVLDPIYDPFTRPNYLVQLNVYEHAGSVKDEQIFAWNMPGRSLVGLDRQEDGSERANRLEFQAGQGGVAGAAPAVDDLDSQAKYGVYEAQQFFPGLTGRTPDEKAAAVAAVTSLAEQQLALRKNGKETVTFSPAPERSPRPWQDYQLGDRVPVWASKEKFRRMLGANLAGTTLDTQYERIYGWTANISDDALETISPVLTSPEDGIS